MKYRHFSQFHYKAPVLGLFDTGAAFNRNRTYFIAGADFPVLTAYVLRTGSPEDIFSKVELVKSGERKS
ncbi:hypothetical protein DAE56_26665 [Salmonella enterica]|nr:hypothetical protein [Salmonella enterica]EEE1292848.1 hypothetical protein [Salmonella enterica subsp. diarizonae]